jgi:hypothetical protein
MTPRRPQRRRKTKLFAKQRLELKCPGEFVRGYLARDRQRLDPVLASHLGLTEPQTKR